MTPSFSDLSWANAQQLISRAVVFLQSRAVMVEGSDVTLELSIAQAIRALDSEGDDDVREYEDEQQTPTYLDASDEVALGELQRIRRLRDILLGEEGLINKLKTLKPNPESPSGP